MILSLRKSASLGHRTVLLDKSTGDWRGLDIMAVRVGVVLIEDVVFLRARYQ